MQCLSAAEAPDGMEAGMRQMARGDAIRRQIYEKAVKLGIGRELPTEMFLQDLPTWLPRCRDARLT